MQIIIAGCGGFGGEVEGWLNTKGITVQNWLDDINPACVDIDAYEPKEGEQVIVAVGAPEDRENIVKRLTIRRAIFHGMLFHIGPPTHRIGGGCVTMPGSVVSAHADVGDFVHIGLSSLVGHHVKVGDYCTLSSQVDLCGHVVVGKRVFFGSGARVLPRVTIGDDAVIGAGAVVLRDVEAGTTVFGNPATRLV